MDKRELLDALEEANRLGWLGKAASAIPSAGGSGGGGSGGSGGGGLSGAAESALKESFDVSKKIATNTMQASDLTNAAGKTLGNFGKTGELAGKTIAELGQYGQESVNKWKEVSKFGASFNNDAIGLRVGAMQTRQTFDEYTGLLRNNKELLAGLGGTVTLGMKAFNTMSKEMFDSKAGVELQQMGMTASDLNEVLAVTMVSNKSINMQDAKSKQAAIESAAQLATEMDLMAKMTGKSREEQMKELKDKQLDVQYQAAERMMMSGLNQQERQVREAAMNELKVSAGNMGPAVAGVVKEMVTGGVRSKEAAQTMSLLGPAGKELQAAVNATKNAKTEGEKVAAEERLRRAENAVLQVQQSKAFQQQVAIGNDAAMNIAKGSQKQQMAMDKVAAETGKSLTNVKEFAETREKIKQVAKDEQKGEEGGEKVAGAETTKAFNNLEIAGRNAGAAINAGIVEPLNKKIAASAPVQAVANEDLTKGKAMGLEKAIPDLGKGGNYEVRKRAKGSLGETGNLLEDFGAGTPAILHGKEAVVTEDQLKNIMKGMPNAEEQTGKVNTFAEDAARIQAVMSNMQSSANIKTPDPKNISEMQKSMTAQIAAVSKEAKNPMAGLDFSGIKLDKNGMPIMSSITNKLPPAPTVSRVDAGTKDRQEQAAKAKEAEQAKAASKKSEAKKDEKSAPSAKQASLDDVVSKLDSLNKTMSRLLATSEELGAKQVKATNKVANKGNAFA